MYTYTSSLSSTILRVVYCGLTLCLTHAGLSAMVRGAIDDSSRFTVIDYSETEVEKILQNYFTQLK